MEKFTVTETFNGGLSQRPIFEQNEPSPLPYTSFPPNSHLRDTSFSSFTRPGEPKLVPEERFRRQIDDTEISIFDAEKYFNEGRDQKEKKQTSTVTVNLDRIPDRRSSLSTVSRLSSSISSVDGYGRNYKSGSFHATPTASSEASWNSQSGLLSIPPGSSIAVSMRNLPLDGKRRGISSKWFFGTRCPCSGKKSVQVDEKLSNPKNPFHSNGSSNRSFNPKKQSSKSGEVAPADRVAKEKAKVFDKNIIIDERTELKSVSGNHLSSPESGHRIVSSNSAGRLVTEGGGGFSFPILNPPVLEDPPSRESLEVFQPSEESVVRKSTELQRQMLMSFAGNSESQSFTFPASPKTRATIGDDDVASDTSSDLFEIESFSTQTTMYPLYHHQREAFDEFSSNDGTRILGHGNGMLQFRRSIDGTMTPSIAPTEFYEPSEISVDWSVTTAEGFDRRSVTNFSTATSEYEDFRFKVQKESEKIIANGGGGASNIRRKGNGLLSCRCEKAVNVGPHPVKQLPDQCRAGGVGTPATVLVESCQIPATTSRLANLSSMHKARASGKPPLARSNSARMSHAFITQ
ncbi:protein PHYTOCHROME KINASE SUBSTRATE 4-like isoform X2 [Telopea speciosissima]|uniref:protein PHYTOCHROME KINASE SUBSTRATE 4-like isoform X2 n=1 Tax=Telopea speciosissima TaxID=54955 RepID=UPI001CC3D5C7|nr:protein PHYTOCHROME KINASE SUBSTRATE 4-like isoform X2 [Telopea speciosissima]